MYTSFFGLSEKPFAITPNPRYLYMSERHAEALAHLMYGLNEAGGFIQLTGEVGTGKTTVVRTLLEQLPQHTDVAVILNPRMSPTELLLTICEELGLFLTDENTSSVKDLVDVLNSRLLATHAKGRKVVVIIDEAQNLLPETLEQVRLLTNLETATHKLMQIILIGQPELRELLARSDLRQLAQRITGRYHLAPLSTDDTAAYVRHRMRVAGATRDIFNERALQAVHRVSRGIPRLINIICDRALLGAYTQAEYEIGPTLVQQAATEVSGESSPATHWKWAVSAAAVILVAGLVSFWYWRGLPATPVKQAVIESSSSSSAISVIVPPAALDAGQVLQQHASSTDTNSAFTTLLALWGASYAPNDTRSCEQATQQGLECVFQKGSWELLRSLNRPAILQLTDDQGAAHQAVVTALDTASAQLMLDNQTVSVTIASLSRYWNGDFLVLWRPKVKDQKVLSAGMRAAEILWLRSSLSKLKGEAVAGKASNLFDDELVATLADFQLTHRLHADGIAGLQTQVALDAAIADAGSPTLINAATNNDPAPSKTGTTP
ncbi:MAG: AAA family ATPase [Steroidobacteraceae bacterium]